MCSLGVHLRVGAPLSVRLAGGHRHFPRSVLRALLRSRTHYRLLYFQGGQLRIVSTQHPRLRRDGHRHRPVSAHIANAPLRLLQRAARITVALRMLSPFSDARHGLYWLFVAMGSKGILRFRGWNQHHQRGTTDRIVFAETAPRQLTDGDTDPIAFFCVTCFCVARSSDCLHCHAYFLVSQGRPCGALERRSFSSQTSGAKVLSPAVGDGYGSKPADCSGSGAGCIFRSDSPWTASGSVGYQLHPSARMVLPADVSVAEGGGRQMVSTWWHCSAGAARLVVCCDSIF